MVIAGQPIAGIGLWLILIVRFARSTLLTVPVPWASLWPSCAICIPAWLLPAVAAGGAVAAAASCAPAGVREAELPRSIPSGGVAGAVGVAMLGPASMQAVRSRAIGTRPRLKKRDDVMCCTFRNKEGRALWPISGA